MKIIIPCKYCKSTKTSFVSQNDSSVKELNNDIASAITSHYWRGISANNDNIVLEVIIS